MFQIYKILKFTYKFLLTTSRIPFKNSILTFNFFTIYNYNFFKEGFLIDFLQKRLVDSVYKNFIIKSTQFFNLQFLNFKYIRFFIDEILINFYKNSSKVYNLDIKSVFFYLFLLFSLSFSILVLLFLVINYFF